VTPIGKNDCFVFGCSKLVVMFGKEEPETVRVPYSAIVKPGVDFRQETILSIDPEQKSMVTDRRNYDGGVHVIALGADLDS
jgi:sulfide:quinone oxidoreductase